MKPGLFQSGFKTWWIVTALIYVVGAFALTFYWLFTESGLVRILIDFQAGERGHWYPKITTVVTLLILLLPLLPFRIFLPVKIPPKVDPDVPDLMRWRG